MKKAHLEQNTNRLLGWYDTDIHSVIPEPNVAVTDSQWQEALDLGANAYENGSFIVKDFRTEAEIQEEEVSIKIAEAKQYLIDTDWIIVKINEAQVLGNDIQPLLEKYTVELAKRLEARDSINILQG